MTPSAKTRGSDAAASAKPEGRPKARVQTPSPRASSAKARSTSRATARPSPRARRRTDGAEGDDDREIDEIDRIDDRGDGDEIDHREDDGEALARPTGLKALFLPIDANYVPPAERARPWWGMGDMGLWFLISQIAGGIAYYIAVAAGGYRSTGPSAPVPGRARSSVARRSASSPRSPRRSSTCRSS